jgi:hypothetical protein
MLMKNRTAVRFQVDEPPSKITTAMIKQESKQRQKSRGTTTPANQNNFFIKHITRKWSTSRPRRGANSPLWKSVETAIYLTLLCEDLEVMSARSEFELSFCHQPLKSDLENLVNLLLTPEFQPFYQTRDRSLGNMGFS